MDTFEYKPLPLDGLYIRTMLLLPAAELDEPVECVLQHCFYDDDGKLRLQGEDGGLPGDIIEPYQALSYVWGDVSNTTTISVNGKALSVTVNLGIALKYLRPKNEACHLWIDAICIDQNNLQERGHQVQRMRGIYERAKEVVVWLGVEFDYLSGYLDGTECWKNKENWTCELVLANSWFQRIWVIQEVAAAKALAFQQGFTRVSARTFLELLKGLRHESGSQKNDAPLKHKYALVQLIDRRFCGTYKEHPSGYGRISDDDMQHPIMASTLAALIDMFHHHQATDQRDKVYAVLGLSVDAYYSKRILPDYNLTISEVYNQVVKFVFGTTAASEMIESAVLRIRCRLFVVGKVVDVDRRHYMWFEWNTIIFSQHVRRTKATTRQQTEDYPRQCWRISFPLRWPVRAGDIVGLTLGAYTPVILRDKAEHKYEVVFAQTPVPTVYRSRLNETIFDPWAELSTTIGKEPERFVEADLIWDLDRLGRDEVSGRTDE